MTPPDVVRAARSPGEFVEAVLAGLFQGITLTAGQTFAARAVIADIAARQVQIDLLHPEGWSRLLRLNDERNAALAALLGSDADRARFEKSAAEAQLAQAVIAWRTPTAAGRRGADAVPMATTSEGVRPPA